MIIWTGLGFLVGVIGFLSLLLTEIVSESITENEYFYQENPWLIFVGMTVAAILTFGLDKVLSLKKPRVVIDKDSGEELELSGTHSFFFIPVRWWPGVFVILGFAFMIAGGGKSPGNVEPTGAEHPAATAVSKQQSDENIEPDSEERTQ